MRRKRLLHDVNTHISLALLSEAQLTRGTPGYVNHVAVFARHSVVDFDHNAPVVLEIGHLHLRDGNHLVDGSYALCIIFSWLNSCSHILANINLCANFYHLLCRF